VAVPQALERDREVRFTFRLRTTITIAGKRVRDLSRDRRPVTPRGRAVSDTPWRRRQPASSAADEQGNWSDQGLGSGKSTAPGVNCAGNWNEGVGEHVRTRFHVGAFAPVKLRNL